MPSQRRAVRIQPGAEHLLPDSTLAGDTLKRFLLTHDFDVAAVFFDIRLL